MNWRKIKKNLEWIFTALIALMFLALINNLWEPDKGMVALMMVFMFFTALEDALEDDDL